MGGMDRLSCCSAWTKLAPQEALAEDGLTVHAGLAEHSAILFLRPDLVPPAIRLIEHEGLRVVGAGYSLESGMVRVFDGVLEPG